MSAPRGNHDGLARPGRGGELIDQLREQLSRWQTADAADAVFSCGVGAIDRLLPGGGLRRGMLVEWVGIGAGKANAPSPQLSPGGKGGGATLGLLAAREACREGGVLVVIDRRKMFYPPAAAAWGIDLERMIVVHPQNARDELWAAVQALRSSVVAAMFSATDRLDSRAFRRLQLAAQAGRSLGILLRPASAREQPSWADVRLEAESRVEGRGSRAGMQALDPRRSTVDFHRRVQVRVLHCHSGRPGGSAMVEIDDSAYTVREAKEGHRRSARRWLLKADG